MLKSSINDTNHYDDVAESSIFDLDHAPAPRSMFSPPHHHSILLQQAPHPHTANDIPLIAAPPPPSISPRPPSGGGGGSSSSSIGRASRKSIVIPMGEHQHVVSLPPTAPPAGAFHTSIINGGTMSKDGGANTKLSGSASLAPIATSFNRRRLSSFSSIPTVGGSYTYGPSTATTSPFYAANDGTMTPRISNNSLRTTTRQRSYSAAAVFSNPSPVAIPPHLAHVRSFPPPRGGSSSIRNEATFATRNATAGLRHSSPSAGTPEDSLCGPDEMYYSPSVANTVPIVRIEETKEPLDGDQSTEEDKFDDDDDDEVDDDNVRFPLTDSEYESDTIMYNSIGTKDRSDTGYRSSGSELPTPTSSSSSQVPVLFPNNGTMNPTEVTLPYSDPTFMYQNDLSETRNYGLNDSMSQNNSNDATTAIKRVMLCGCIPLPLCFSKRRISWDRVASFIAVWSPCFVCFRMEYSTYRAVLFRLNVISGFMAIVQLVASSFHFAVLHSRTLVNRNLPTSTLIEIKNENDNRFEVLTNVWNLNGSVVLLGLVALVVFVAVVSTVRAIQNVNLAGAIRYYWLILWVLPLQAFWAVTMFDYFQVTEVWIKFWWRDRTMAWFRHEFCDPSDTYNAQCAVPVFANPDNETAWCQDNYNSTACTSIRDKAQEETARFLYTFYSCTSAWTVLFMLSLFLVMKTLESIITSPLVEKSRESSIPSWLMLPMAACFICGSLFSYSPSSILNIRYESATHLQWIAPSFMAAGAMFFVLALLAWLLWTCPITQTSHKHNKSIAIAVFILTSFAMIIIMATIFASCIVESFFLGGSVSDSVRGQIACSIDQSGSCTYCTDDLVALNYTVPNVAPEDQCPEWSMDYVVRILQSQAKSGANLAVICMLYAIGAFRYGLTVRKHIINYKIAYV